MNEESKLASFKFIFDKRMLPFIPFTVFRSMSFGSQAAVYINFWVMLINSSVDQDGEKTFKDLSSDEKIAQAILTYIAMGVGMVVGPWPLGLL